MIHIFNKYDLLKNQLNVGEKISTSIIKKITDNKAVVSIKGYNVVVKSDTPLTENFPLSFLISGFNEKEKVILLKSIQQQFNIPSEQKFLQAKSYIRNFLVENKIPVNLITLDIAHYLFLKENKITLDTLRFIYKYYQDLKDIPLLYRLFKYSSEQKFIIPFIKLFNFILKKEGKIREEKKYNSDIINDWKKDIKEQIKVFSNNKNVINVLSNDDNDEKSPLFYSLFLNQKDETGLLLPVVISDQKGWAKIHCNILTDIILFTIDFSITEEKIVYKFILFLKEQKAVLTVDVKNKEWNQKISAGLDGLQEKIDKILKIDFEIFINGKEKSNTTLKNLDIYV